MSPGRRYWLGMAVVAGGALAARVLRPAWAGAIDLALALTVAVQGPLGWWLIRSVGTPRLLVAWVAGMLGRIAVLGLAALLLIPAAGLPLSPALPILGALLVAGLAVEVLVLTLQPSQAEHE